MFGKSLIFVQIYTRKATNSGDKTEYHEKCHTLKGGFSKYPSFLIDSWASNHVVSSKQSLFTLKFTGGPIIHMGDDTQIQFEGKGISNLLC